MVKRVGPPPGRPARRRSRGWRGSPARGQADALPAGLGGEERREEVRAHLSGMPGPVSSIDEACGRPRRCRIAVIAPAPAASMAFFMMFTSACSIWTAIDRRTRAAASARPGPARCPVCAPRRPSSASMRREHVRRSVAGGAAAGSRTTSAKLRMNALSWPIAIDRDLQGALEVVRGLGACSCAP